MKILYTITVILVSLVTSVYGQPYIHQNAEANTLLITVFTVFAGFLVAIIAVVGDPALIPSGSWRKVEVRRDALESRLLWQLYLFVGYLFTIGLIFVVVLLKNAKEPPILLILIETVEFIYLFTSVLCFLLSFYLPWTLLAIQQSRIDAELARRRTEVRLS